MNPEPRYQRWVFVTTVVIGSHQAAGVRHRFGNLERFFPECTALSEQAELSMAHGELGPGDHGGRVGKPKTLVGWRFLEGRHRLPEAADRPMIVALRLRGSAEIVVRLRAQADLPAGRGKGQGALSGGDDLVIRTDPVELVWQKERHLSQPTWVIEGRGEGLGLA
jgi:hypothetical protein